MKNNDQKNFELPNLKAILGPALWFFFGMAFIFLMGTALSDHSGQIIKSVEIEIDNESGHSFLSEAKINSFLNHYYDKDQFDFTVGDVNLHELEWALNEHPYVKEADLFFDLNSSLFIQIEPKTPIVRVIGDKDNQDYYISQSGYKMPKSDDYTARVMIATGNISDNGKNVGKIETETNNKLFELATFISQHEILSALIEQIHYESDSKIKLIPKLGNWEIILGDANNLKRKFTNLLALYKNELSQNGWKIYESIDLSFENHIVCSAKK